MDVQGQRRSDVVERQPEESTSSSFPSQVGKPEDGEAELKKPESSVSKFVDERWKKGTWDLNMFVENGRMDWDAVIVAGECFVFFSMYKSGYFGHGLALV